VEWNYVAAAGPEQRMYPWGNFDPAENHDLAVYQCNVGTTSSMTIARVSRTLLGGFSRPSAAAPGSMDMAGEMSEWTLDWDAQYAEPCLDCAAVGADVKPGTKVDRGGGFFDPTPALLHTAAPTFAQPSGRVPGCRAPLCEGAVTCASACAPFFWLGGGMCGRLFGQGHPRGGLLLRHVHRWLAPSRFAAPRGSPHRQLEVLSQREIRHRLGLTAFPASLALESNGRSDAS